MKRRILAFLLALVMVVGMVPTSVFADMAEEVPEEAASVIEEVEAPEEEPEEAEELPSEPEEIEEEVPEEEPELEEIPEENVALEAAAADARVTFTISNQGVLAQTPDGKDAIELPVTVTDRNADGILTYDEALVALHEEYCQDGYSISGGWVTKLWNTPGTYTFTTNDVHFGVLVNDKTCTVKTGDKLYACIQKDQKTWSDVITFFDRKALTVDAYQEFTLNLQGGTTMGKDGYVQGAVAGAQVGTWKDGKFTALDGVKTDDRAM